MAPEVMEQIHGYDTKADIWSLGITAMELAKGEAPYARYPPMKVLLLTIQEDPPSLDTYMDYEEEDFDRKSKKHEVKWSRSFRSMIDWCLQKDPAKRPNCEELLNHEHFRPLKDENVREMYRLRMKEEICDLIPNVGDEHERQQRDRERARQENQQDRSSGGGGGVGVGSGGQNVPKPQVERQTSDNILPVSSVVEASLKNAPSGTTWVFDDGSHVARSASGSTSGDRGGGEDFFEEFERTTQGENFKHPSMAVLEEKSKPTRDKDKANSEKEKETVDDDKDDLNAFMDQFEKETSGENFKNSSL